MAGEQARAFIAKERSAGIPDIKIFNKMLDDPKFSQGIRRANADGISNRVFAAGLGLKISSVPVDLNVVKRESMLKQAKEEGPTNAVGSFFLGLADIFGGARQGTGYVVDGISKGINKVAGTNLSTNEYERYTKQFKEAEDWHNLRREANGQSYDVWRLGGQAVGSVPMATAGRTYQGAKVLSKAGTEIAAQNAAVGMGIGGASFAENADQRISNIRLGTVGGAVGGAVGEKVAQGVVKTVQVGKSLFPQLSATKSNQILASVDQNLDAVLKSNGMSLASVSNQVREGLRKDAKKALQSGYELNPEAVARKVIFDSLGLKGTKAQLTGDAKLWQKQAELAKIDQAGDPLRSKLIQDNVQLKSLLDDATTKTGGRATDQYGAMQGALDSLEGQLAKNKDHIRAAYNVARDAPGNEVLLDGRGFANDAFTALDKNYAASSLPANVQKIIKDINEHSEMFTLGKSEEFIKILNREHKASLQNGQPTSATYSIGLVRDALNGRQKQAMQGLISNGNDAAQAYQFARQAHKLNVEQIESMPLLQDVVKGIEPDKLFNKHILNGNTAELSKTIDLLQKVNPQAVSDIKQQVLQFISNKSVNQNGQFSAAGMKRALDTIGTRRLATMFKPDEISHIQNIGKAAHYLVTQPAHAYINNSNTASAVMNHLLGVINKPGIRMLLAPVKDIKDSLQVRAMMKPNLPTGNKKPPTVPTSLMIDKLVEAGLISGSNLPKQ